MSLVDNVTRRLRAALLIGEIQPGEAIRVNALEKRFDVSHIPIREALRRLEMEGFVIALHRRATVAVGVDLEDLNGLYDLRKIIECEVARRTASGGLNRCGLGGAVQTGCCSCCAGVSGLAGRLAPAIARA